LIEIDCCITASRGFRASIENLTFTELGPFVRYDLDVVSTYSIKARMLGSMRIRNRCGLPPIVEPLLGGIEAEFEYKFCLIGGLGRIIIVLLATCQC